jgi:tetratricopeptide (TPR) repeat protein
LQLFQGQNYIKDAYRKLAWYELVIKHNPEGYHDFMNKCVTEGVKIVEEDKAAYKEALERKPINKKLLEARIYFDGGYGVKADLALSKIIVQELSPNEQIEFYYRSARVNILLDKTEEGIINFEKCIDLGADSDLYYACNSSLLLGNIYETRGKLDFANEYYRNCLKMRPSEYKIGIHQKAKSGLNRLK